MNQNSEQIVNITKKGRVKKMKKERKKEENKWIKILNRREKQDKQEKEDRAAKKGIEIVNWYTIEKQGEQKKGEK